MLQNLTNLAVSIIIAGIVIFLGMTIIGQIFTVGIDTFTGNSNLISQLNTTLGTLFTTFNTLTGFLPIIVLAGLAAIVLFTIFNAFRGGMR